MNRTTDISPNWVFTNIKIQTAWGSLCNSSNLEFQLGKGPGQRICLKGETSELPFEGSCL